MIRLSTAHAKARLSKSVGVEDAQAAIELVQFAYFKRVLEKEKKRRRRQNSGDGISDDENEAENRTTKRSRRLDPSDPNYEPYDYEEEEGVEDSSQPTDRNLRKKKTSETPSETATQSQSQPTEQPTTQISTARLTFFFRFF